MSTVTRLPQLVCEAHPDREFGHGGCPGPGCPPEHRDRLLTELLRDLRIAAAFGDPGAARWLDRHNIDQLPWKDDR